MLLLAACVLGLLSPLLVGRWPAGLLLHPWRWPLLIWVTLGLQVVAVEVPLPGVLAPVLHVLTYVVVVGFLWLNRSLDRIAVVAAGTASNGVTIALNGGVLPASADAVRAAALDPHLAFANSAVVAHPVLPWLGDVFAWPAPLPLANTFSVGDVLIAVGVVLVAWTGTCRLGRTPVRRAVAPDATGGGTTSPTAKLDGPSQR
ncbi:hypothetical protein DDP54_00085 (plasmid) [Cellulomonas sp. WB94]|uniref:DUF5317 family protein n=1 Tax=Cellulomonas sp. WB94 TaxID=2173174 RepID=UPI000D5758B1|nr:DUF5317 family protein [Cellulomonas sp. WB94]PVU84295.1 hypothetical protein DDP54_00085 [Cellulomonas sp. WB94]